MSRRIPVVAFALLVVACIAPHFSPVAAHAVLVRSTPADGAMVAGPNIHFELQFNSRVDPRRSLLTIAHGHDESVTLKVSAGDKPSDLKADARDIMPGDYTAHWQALATDGHITRGSFIFHVR